MMPSRDQVDRCANGGGPCCVLHTRPRGLWSREDGKRGPGATGEAGAGFLLPVCSAGIHPGAEKRRDPAPGPRTRLTAARAEQALGAFDTPGPALWSREDGRRGPGATGEAGAGFRLPVCSAGIHPGAEKRRDMVPDRERADRYASGAGPCCVRHTRRCAFVSGRRQARSWADWGSWRGLPVPGLLSGNPSWRGKTPGAWCRTPETRLTAARAEQALGAFDTPGPALWSREDGRRGSGATGEAGAGFRLPVCSAEKSILARKNAGAWCRTENRVDRCASGAGPWCEIEGCNPPTKA